jgi:hypothetical protein
MLVSRCGPRPTSSAPAISWTAGELGNKAKIMMIKFPSKNSSLIPHSLPASAIAMKRQPTDCVSCGNRGQHCQGGRYPRLVPGVVTTSIDRLGRRLLGAGVQRLLAILSLDRSAVVADRVFCNRPTATPAEGTTLPRSSPADRAALRHRQAARSRGHQVADHAGHDLDQGGLKVAARG